MAFQYTTGSQENNKDVVLCSCQCLVMLCFLVLGHNIYPTQHFLVADLIVLNKTNKKNVLLTRSSTTILSFTGHTLYAQFMQRKLLRAEHLIMMYSNLYIQYITKIMCIFKNNALICH